MYHFFFRFFVIMQSPAHKEEESCLHHEPFFPELFSFYSETGMSSLYFHLKAALPEERAAHASSTAFSRRRTGSDLSVVFFVSSAKTHAKYDSCASHAEHEIFCCFSHSITCICGRCFICQIAGSIIFVRSIARIGTIILSRIVFPRFPECFHPTLCRERLWWT